MSTACAIQPLSTNNDLFYNIAGSQYACVCICHLDFFACFPMALLTAAMRYQSWILNTWAFRITPIARSQTDYSWGLGQSCTWMQIHFCGGRLCLETACFPANQLKQVHPALWFTRYSWKTHNYQTETHRGRFYRNIKLFLYDKNLPLGRWRVWSLLGTMKCWGRANVHRC